LKDFKKPTAAAFLPSLSKILLRPGRTLVFHTLVISLSFLVQSIYQALLQPTNTAAKEKHQKSSCMQEDDEWKTSRVMIDE
jgi:hypothetical protein